MKHTLTRTLKKITAAALSFVILGAGTVITKNYAPKSQNMLTAYATSCTNCHGGSYHVQTRYEFVTITIYGAVFQYRIDTVYCGLCGKVLETTVHAL